MTKIDTTKPSREFDAWIDEHVFEREVVGEAECSRWDGPWDVDCRVFEDTPERNIRPVYVKHCGCDLPIPPDERELYAKLHGHYTTCLAAVPERTADIAAAWTVDRPGWMWNFAEAPHGLQVTIYPTRELFDVRPYDFGMILDGIVSVVVPWDVGTKAEVYALGRCQAAYTALSGGEM